MSSLLSSSTDKIIEYWESRLPKSEYKEKFLLTKAIEINTFKHNSEKREIEFSESQVFKHSDYKHNIRDGSIISVIIPVYIRTEFDTNCASRLIKCLLEQTRKPDYIIFIDDCSPTKFEYPELVINFKLSENKGPAAARNKGIDIALQKKSDIIVFTDLDCVPKEDWIENIELRFLNDKSSHLLSGNTLSYNKVWFGKYHELNGTLNGRKFINSDLLLYGTTCNLAVLREVAETVKFSESFPNAASEDIEFCFKAAKKSFNIKHCSKAIIYHDYGYSDNFGENLEKFNKQFTKYAKGEKILLELIPDYYTYFDNTEEIQATN